MERNDLAAKRAKRTSALGFGIWALVLLQMVAAVGCSLKYGKEDGTRLLAGSYRLITTNSCTYGPVDSDRLTLFTNGRLEQHVVLRDGRRFDSEQGRWEFFPPSNVFLEDRWDYHFEANQKEPEKGFYSLVVEFPSKG